MRGLSYGKHRQVDGSSRHRHKVVTGLFAEINWVNLLTVEHRRDAARAEEQTPRAPSPGEAFRRVVQLEGVNRKARKAARS